MPRTLILSALFAIRLLAESAIPGRLDEEKWWHTLADPQLDRLIERAVQNKLDLQLSTQRILQARAARGVARADLLPSAGQSVSFQRLRGRFPEPNLPVGTGPFGRSLIAPSDTSLVRSGLDASWELDLFGGKRNALKAATAEVRASEETRRDVLVSLMSEVAGAYAELRGAQRRLAITERNGELQRDALRLTQARADAGLGTRLDVERQQAQLESTAALAPTLESQVARTIHRLSTLLGEPPSALLPELQAATHELTIPPEVPPALPGDLLKRRPDVRRADAGIAAAMARVGMAKADLFPRILLTGVAGGQSSGAPVLSLGAGNFFSIGTAITLPFLSSGRLRANLEVRKRQLDEALTIYRKAVLVALAETEDSLVAYQRERDRRARLESALKSNQAATELAIELYTCGLSDFLSVLDAQRTQLAAEDLLAQSDTAVITNLVMLYKALGGGWRGAFPEP